MTKHRKIDLVGWKISFLTKWEFIQGRNEENGQNMANSFLMVVIKNPVANAIAYPASVDVKVPGK